LNYNSTNDDGMHAEQRCNASFSCENHNGKIASGTVAGLLFPILVAKMYVMGI